MCIYIYIYIFIYPPIRAQRATRTVAEWEAVSETAFQLLKKRGQNGASLRAVTGQKWPREKAKNYESSKNLQALDELRAKAASEARGASCERSERSELRATRGDATGRVHPRPGGSLKSNSEPFHEATSVQSQASSVHRKRRKKHEVEPRSLIQLLTRRLWELPSWCVRGGFGPVYQLYQLYQLYRPFFQKWIWEISTWMLSTWK